HPHARSPQPAPAARPGPRRQAHHAAALVAAVSPTARATATTAGPSAGGPERTGATAQSSTHGQWAIARTWWTAPVRQALVADRRQCGSRAARRKTPRVARTAYSGVVRGRSPPIRRSPAGDQAGNRLP